MLAALAFFINYIKTESLFLIIKELSMVIFEGNIINIMLEIYWHIIAI